jgi:hypothetical protein
MDSSNGAVEHLDAAIGHQVSGLGRRAAVSRIRSGLRPEADELDQVARLVSFRRAHPEVIVGDGGFGTMQARIPEPNGETVITRYTLRELLDRLDELRP